MKAYKIVTQNRRSVFAKGKYRKTYKKGAVVKAPSKGAVVKAPSRTVGLMCFESETAAQRFSNLLRVIPVRVIPGSLWSHLIIEVEGLGEPKRPYQIAPAGTESCLDEYYKLRKKMGEAVYAVCTCTYATPPKDTVCFDAVKVLT